MNCNKLDKTSAKIPIEFKNRGISTPPIDTSSTHVQYTQTDTIRQTDGPLVPMVGLVPVEKNVIAMVLLVNMHEGDLDCFHLWPGWVQGNSDGPFLPYGTIGTNRK